LAYLGDEEASNEYLYLLTDRQAWNNVNRGFHLEYYADIPFDPERQLSHEDRLGSFTRTYESLRERIVGNINNRDYGLFNIEVFTLYSLAQHRHARRGRLPENIRLDLLSLIPRLLDADNVSAQVRDYLLMLEDNLQEPDFPVGRLAEQLYGLKTEIRAGWVERHLDVERIESVAEHTIGTCVLGLLYLPEGNPENWQGYDKTEVLQMLMIHDLAEALSGDVTFRNSTDATREKERQAFRYIMMCRTYPRVADLQSYYERWEQFEAAANENARIARDLDRLENLMQLYLYQRVAEVEDYQDWKTQLISNISTPAGKRILDIIRDNFEGERVQPTRSSGEQGSTSGGS
jgi:5'-deoxynucleotidase YfbR-like HD superfamily hydrolase